MDVTEIEKEEESHEVIIKSQEDESDEDWAEETEVYRWQGGMGVRLPFTVNGEPSMEMNGMNMIYDFTFVLLAIMSSSNPIQAQS